MVCMALVYARFMHIIRAPPVAAWNTIDRPAIVLMPNKGTARLNGGKLGF